MASRIQVVYKSYAVMRAAAHGITFSCVTLEPQPTRGRSVTSREEPGLRGAMTEKGLMLSTFFRARVPQMLMTDREESAEAATGQAGQVSLRIRSSRA